MIHRKHVLAWAAGAALAGLVSLPALVTAQAEEAPLLKVKVAVAPTTVARGGKGVMKMTLQVKEGFHINAVEPGNEYAIPTVLKGKAPAGVTLGKPVFPKATPINMPGFDTPINVYSGTVEVTVPFTVSAKATPGKTHPAPASV